jgi:enolase
MKIAQVIARELFDSSGFPTVQCEIILDTGESVTAMVPRGNSVGRYEARELRDHEPRLEGMGTRKSLEIIETLIAPLLVGQEPRALELDLKIIELDGTPDKVRLGANTMLAVSQALYRAEALWHDIELFELFAALYNADTVMMPIPMINVINGGLHASNNLTIQEILIVPVGAPTFRAGLELGITIYHELGKMLKGLGKSTAVGLEGGYASSFLDEYEALDILNEVLERVNAQYSSSCMIALDMAASQWTVEEGLYLWHQNVYTTDEMIARYKDLINRYPLYSIEDPLGHDDWQGWQKLSQELGNRVQLVGDDLFATNVQRIARGVYDKAASASIIKPNQIGTITEVLQAIIFCKDQHINTIVSHRSSDTEDTFISDLAVGTSSGQIKIGAPCRSERVAKYNRLLVIEETLTFSSEQS